MRKKYEKLYDIYPELISLNQLYKICKVSKRTAAYLIDNGIIPCTQSDNKTWKYKIKLCDVITYLRRREQWGSAVQKGAINSKRGKKSRYSFSQVITEKDSHRLRNYFHHESKIYPDVVTTKDIASLFGLNCETIRRIVSSGDLEPIIRRPKIIVPMKRVLDFVTTPRFINLYSNSEDFKAILGGYLEWINAKS